MTRQAVLVTGGREYRGSATIRGVLYGYPIGTLVIHGNAPGADSIAGAVAIARGMPYAEVPYFKGLGKAGGPARNRVMLDILLGLRSQGYEICVEAFHEDLTKSKGTKDMIKQAEKAGVTVGRHT